MKKSRFLYLAGIVGGVFVVLGVLWFGFFLNVMGGETAVSPSAPLTKEVSDAGWLTAVSNQLQEAEYAVTAVTRSGGGQIAYQAPNRAQNLRTYFSSTGIQIEPRLVHGEAWRFGLEVVGVGDGVQTAVPEIAAHTVADNRITLDYGAWQAWYVNGAQGVEQGFTIERPLFAEETGLLQLEMAVTGSLIPRLDANGEMIRLVTAVGEQILTYRELAAFDAQGRNLPATMELAALPDGGDAILLAVDTSGAEYPIVVDPIIGGGVLWETWIDHDAGYGFAVSSAGDVNGDGYADVLVGAPWFDGGQPDEGAVFAYYGDDSGLQPMAQWVVESNVPHMGMGVAVNPAGDVNGDGYVDIIVGTNLSPTGKVFIFAGSANGLTLPALWSANGAQPGDGFGLVVDSAGDVNLDGYDDVIIGAPFYDGYTGVDTGRAYVFYGSDSGMSSVPGWIAEGGESGSPDSGSGGLFGHSVSDAGDVNGDGFSDVIIGVPMDISGSDPGAAVIFCGSAAGLVPGTDAQPARRDDADWVSYGTSPPGTGYGFAVSYAGDVNNDGYGDVVIGAPWYSGISTNSGATFVFTGTDPISNMASVPIPNSRWAFFSSVPDAELGHSVRGAGDIDNDGYDEVIAGALRFDGEAMQVQQAQVANGGGVFLLRGSQTGIDFSRVYYSTSPNAKLGVSVSTAGDVNGDGYMDIIMGAPEMPSPDNSLGEAYAVYGSGQISDLMALNDSPTLLHDPTHFEAHFTEGGLVEAKWGFGDGMQEVGAFAEHVYAEPGYYTAVVTLTSFTDEVTATTAVTISVGSIIDPVNGGTIPPVVGPNGFGAGATIPPGAISETMQLTYTPLLTVPHPLTGTWESTGYYFDLSIDRPDWRHQLYLPLIVKGDDGGGTAVVAPFAVSSGGDSYDFAVPITITLVYTDTGMTPGDETSLKLPYRNTMQQQWIDIAKECGLANTYIYHPLENYFTVQVCHLSKFSVAH
jgi:hypothetical protein